MLLKDGREISIGLFGTEKLEALTKEFPLTTNQVCQGFTYFSPKSITHMKRLNRYETYSKEKSLSLLEIHSERNLPNNSYHKGLVALLEEKPIGFLICQWIKNNYFFWRYHIKFIDVHKEFRNIGVATALIENLDRQDFLASKILQRGITSVDGELYTTKIFDRSLKGERYALIPSDFSFQIPPTKVGIYNNFGNLIS